MAEVKRDCFAYNKGSYSKPCIALDDLYCKKEECKFYKTKEQFEKERKMYGGTKL